jgi:hypothetical protein
MSTPVLKKPFVTNVPNLEMITDLFPYEETSDPNARTHIINPPKNLHIWTPGMETQELVDIARVTGQEIEALCGYRFVPKHNPEKFDVCEKCMKIAGDLMAGAGE